MQSRILYISLTINLNYYMTETVPLFDMCYYTV